VCRRFVALQGIATTTRASDQDAIIARLDALEKENAALRQRLNRIERPGATYQRAAPRAASRLNPPRASELEIRDRAALMMDAHAQSNPPPAVYKSPAPWSAAPHFEVSGSLLFLQPGAGNLE
jgi:hypothetical protein